MFKASKFLDSVGPAKFLFLWIIRLIQTKVEHRPVTNNGVAAMVRGDIVISDGPGTVVLADSNSGWIGVCSQPIAIGETRVVRNNGYALVHMIDDIAPEDLIEGYPIHLSPTPGAASMFAGDGPRIGILANASIYNGDNTSDDYNPFVYACLGYECPPNPVMPL